FGKKVRCFLKLAGDSMEAIRSRNSFSMAFFTCKDPPPYKIPMTCNASRVICCSSEEPSKFAKQYSATRCRTSYSDSSFPPFTQCGSQAFTVEIILLSMSLDFVEKIN